jgi:DNA-binding XRE family transcriptional regulator
LALAHLEVSAGAERKHEGAWPTVATAAGVALNTVYEFEKGRRTPAAYID